MTLLVGYRRKPWAGALFAAVLLLIGSAATGVSGQASPNQRAAVGEQGITALGQGSATLPPDQALISGSVQTQAGTAADALDQNSQTVQAVITAIEATGVGAGNIQTTQLSLYPIYAPPTPPTPGASPSQPAIVAYQVTEGIGVTLTGLTKVSDVVQTMVGAGLNSFGGIQYELQNPEQLRIEALQAASADAQQQAQVLAVSLGVSLGAVLSSSILGTTAPPLPYLQVPVTAMASQKSLPATGGVLGLAAPPLQPGMLTATASVSVTYAIAGR
ncbi:MAG: SIMPL domain-containing protein [Dehalococcoidia bacterium]